MTHISSTYRLHITCVYVHVRKGAREVLDRIFISSAKLLQIKLASARNASYCELATINLHMLTYICVGLRKIKISDGFRRCWVSSFMFQMVSERIKHLKQRLLSENDSDNDCDSDEQRFWLEASTYK